MSDLAKALEALTATNVAISKFITEKKASGSAPTEEQIEKMANAIVEKQLKAQKADFDKQIAELGRKAEYNTAEEAPQGPPPEAIVEKSEDPRVRSFQRWNDDCVILSAALKKDPRRLERFRKGLEKPGVSEMRKAMDTATTNEGKEWVPTILSADLYDRVRVANRVYSLFPEIALPGPNYELPVVKADSAAKLVGENTADSGTEVGKSTPQTDKVLFVVKKLATHVVLSEELREDSLIPVLEFVKNNMAQAIADGLEDALLNGDTAGTHMDNDTTASDDPRKAWDGLRKIGQTAQEVSIATLSTANLRSMRGKMGKYASDPEKLVWILSPKGYIKFLGITEVLTKDKYGDQATIVTGELAKFDGTPIVLSGKMRDDVAATGVNTLGGPNTKGIALLAYVPAFITGNLRRLTVREFFDPRLDQHFLVNTWRGAFKTWLPVTEPIVSEGIDLTV